MASVLSYCHSFVISGNGLDLPMRPQPPSLLAKITANQDPYVMRMVLIVGGLFSVVVGPLLGFLFPERAFPLWVFLVIGVSCLSLGVAAGFNSKLRNNLPELSFLQFILAYLGVIFLAYLNQLPFAFAAILLVFQVLFALSFRRLGDFAIFGMASILLFTVCSLAFADLEVEPRMFILLVSSATIASGIYLWLRESAQRRIQEAGLLLDEMLHDSGMGTFLLDDKGRKIIYGNERGEKIFKQLSDAQLNAEQLLSSLDLTPSYLLVHLKEAGTVEKREVSSRHDFVDFQVHLSKLDLGSHHAFLIRLFPAADHQLNHLSVPSGHPIADTLLNSIPDILLTLDYQGMVLSMRSPDRFPHLQPVGQFVDHPFSLLSARVMSSAKQKEATHLLQAARTTGKIKQMEFQTVTDEEILFFDLRIVPVPEQEKILAMIRDITAAKEVEKALSQSEQKYQEIFDAVTDGVLIIEPDQFFTKEANRVVKEMLGYSLEELSGFPVTQLQAFHENDEVYEFLDQCRKGQSQSLECTLARKEGGWVEVEMTAKMVVIEGEYRIMMTFRDITERIEFTQSIGRYSDLFQSADIGMLILHLDRREDDSSLRMVTANRHAERLLGKKANAIAGKYIDQVMPNWRLFKIPELMAQVVQTKEAQVLNDMRYHDTRLQPQYWQFKFTPLPGQYVGMLFEIVTERKEREILLRSSEKRFKDLFNGSPEAIYVTDLGGNIKDANVAACRLHKTEKERLVRANFLALLSAEKQEESKDNFAAIVRGKTNYMESYALDSNGMVIPVEIRGNKFELEGEPALILHVGDISERRAAEDRLRLFRSLINQSTDMIFVVDSQTGKVIDFNERLPATLGYSYAEMRELKLSQFSFTLQHLPLKTEDVRRLTQKGSSIYIGRHRRKDGSNFPVEVNIGFVSILKEEYLVGVARDITERLHSEATLRQSEQKYRTLVERMNEGLILTDNDETILFVNTRMCQILGVNKEEMLGQRSYEVLSSDNEEIQEMIKARSALRRKGISDQYELKLRKANGDTLWVLVAGAPYVDSRGDSIGTIAIITDITNRKLTELKLTEKNNELDAFVYKASHDLKGPLASIIGLTNIARDEVPDTKAHRYFDLIAKSTKRLDTILLELIDVTRINKAKLKYEEVKIDQLVEEIINSLRHQPKSEKVRFETDIRLRKGLKTDKKILLSVLQNLIVNSINYQNPLADPPFVKVRARENHGRIYFQVEDNGQGIPERLQPRVFEMFYRGNTQSKGSGLGLYIVKSAIEKLGGTCELSSEEGIGTIFSFTLPIKTEFQPENTIEPRLEINQN
jgi:PAS domain S-box-containing protein